jgi:2-(1,2-epoxy-1,2-dihydrophenyl)acetyl-CoA isomerase
MSKQVVKAVREGSVLAIRLCSPENRNALSMELRQQLGDIIEEAERDRAIRAVFLTGEGPTFCSGGDFKTLQANCDPWPVHRRFRNLSRWLTPLITLDKPVVVGVRGQAVGGGMGLALTGDVIIVGESTKLISGFFRLGTVPDVGMMYHLPRLIGMARAKNFLFGGATMSAQEAVDLGLAAKMVPDDQVEAAGLAEAARLAEGPAEVMGLAKTLMARSFETTLADMCAFEGFGQVLAMSNPEFREGLSAAMNNRRPDFPSAAVDKTHAISPGQLPLAAT